MLTIVGETKRNLSDSPCSVIAHADTLHGRFELNLLHDKRHDGDESRLEECFESCDSYIAKESKGRLTDAWLRMLQTGTYDFDSEE